MYWSWKSILNLAIAAYVLVCRLLLMHKRFHYATRESLRKMTNEDAYEIQLYLAELEFPRIFSIALGYALFKTYGIPSISRVLVSTGQLSNRKTISRRNADTAVLLSEIVLNPPTSPRSIQGLVRLNYLHGLYRQTGQISNADMLYTLSLFALEPMRWIRTLEWRACSEMESCAIGVYWKSLGDAMDISWHELRCSAGSDDGKGWADGLQFLDDLRDWSLRYERDKMTASSDNHKVAETTVEHRLQKVPAMLHKPVRDLFISLIEDQLRSAVIFDKPPPIYHRLFHTFLQMRRLILRHLFLPRPTFLRRKFLSPNPDPKTGRYHFLKSSREPWYQKPKKPGLWRKWLLGGAVGNDDGKEVDRYRSAGYLIEELGPESFEKSGRVRMEETRVRLKNGDRGGCPFAFS